MPNYFLLIGPKRTLTCMLPPHVLYDVKYANQVSLAPPSGQGEPCHCQSRENGQYLQVNLTWVARPMCCMVLIYIDLVPLESCALCFVWCYIYIDLVSLAAVART